MARRVFPEAGVEDGIGYLVTEFVGVSFPDRF
jgi:hypothetical protein